MLDDPITAHKINNQVERDTTQCSRMHSQRVESSKREVKEEKKEPVSCLIDHAGTPGIYSACLIIYFWATFRLRWTWQNVVYPIPPPLICIRSSSSYLSDASQDAPDCRLALSEYGACLPDRLDRQTSNYNNNNVLGWNIIKSIKFQLKRKTLFLISFPYFSYGI